MERKMLHERQRIEAQHAAETRRNSSVRANETFGRSRADTENYKNYMVHALMENRNGLVVNTCVTHANGTAECTAAVDMIEDIRSAIDGRTTRHKGYRISLKTQKRIEEVFGDRNEFYIGVMRLIPPGKACIQAKITNLVGLIIENSTKKN